MKKKKSRVKNMFIKKVNSSVSLEEIRKRSTEKKECGHLLKQNVYEDLSAVREGRGE